MFDVELKWTVGRGNGEKQFLIISLLLSQCSDVVLLLLICSTNKSNILREPSCHEPGTKKTLAFMTQKRCTILASSQCFSSIAPRGSLPMDDTNNGLMPRRARHSVELKRKLYFTVLTAALMQKTTNKQTNKNHHSRIF